jgi:hypothetical protein
MGAGFAALSEHLLSGFGKIMHFGIIMDLSVVTVLPSLSAVGSWEEVLLFSMDFTVSQNILELELQDANFCFKNLAFAFLTDCVYWS